MPCLRPVDFRTLLYLCPPPGSRYSEHAGATPIRNVVHIGPVGAHQQTNPSNPFIEYQTHTKHIVFHSNLLQLDIFFLQHTPMVKIFLNADGTQVPFLSIPDSDVQRLSRRPFKWLRYVMFAICGAHGDISMTLDGPPVDYSSSSLANATYHYNPTGTLLIILSMLNMLIISHLSREFHICGS